VGGGLRDALHDVRTLNAQVAQQANDSIRRCEITLVIHSTEGVVRDHARQARAQIEHLVHRHRGLWPVSMRRRGPHES
jgi:hypothetical protein